VEIKHTIDQFHRTKVRFNTDTIYPTSFVLSTRCEVTSSDFVTCFRPGLKTTVLCLDYLGHKCIPNHVLTSLYVLHKLFRNGSGTVKQRDTTKGMEIIKIPGGILVDFCNPGGVDDKSEQKYQESK